MRDILTNNGAPSGVVLPDSAYGFVVISVVDSNLVIDEDARILVGNFRILDDLGYEYRANSGGQVHLGAQQPDRRDWYFNFNTLAGVTLSDVVAINVSRDDDFSQNEPSVEVNILDAWKSIEVDIFNINAVIRKVIAPFFIKNYLLCKPYIMLGSTAPLFTTDIVTLWFSNIVDFLTIKNG